MDVNACLAELVKNLAPVLDEFKFKPVYPEGVKKGEFPAAVQGGKISVDFSGEAGTVRLEYFNDRVALLYSENEGEQTGLKKLSETLLECEHATEKELKSKANELGETLGERVGKKKRNPQAAKLQQPVSKAAAKSGALSYDANTLGSRFTVAYPELRAEYKANVERYGEFLPEEFFKLHGNAVVHAIIRENDKQKMTKLFKLLNEIYEDGTNEAQSIIAVTILGSLGNDQQLIARCLDYMCEDMKAPVIYINKYLASRGGKSARMRLENPPPYKPKKPKRKNPITNALGM